LASFWTAWAPATTMTVSAWADAHRYLARETTSAPGRWSTARTPYLREVMDALSARSGIREVVMMTGSQIGKSEAALNFIGYSIEHAPGPMMLVLPTAGVAELWAQQRFAPTIEVTAVLDELVNKRGANNTIARKKFPGGVLAIAGANSSADLRSTPVRDLILDEVDAFPLDLDGQGDPVELARRRTDNFRGKLFMTSTPTIKGTSRIEAAFLAGDQRHFYVLCPECGEFQLLQWENVHWPEGDPDSAWMVCTANGCEIHEGQKGAMLAAGEWRPHNPDAPTWRRSYCLNSLYAPLGWSSWGRLAREHVEATAAAKEGDITKMKVFHNTRLAQSWAMTANKLAPHELQARALDYPRGTIPEGGLLLVGAVDVQANRLELLISAFGRDRQVWVVDHIVIMGDTSGNDPWLELDRLRIDPWPAAGGGRLHLISVAIDSGFMASRVYEFCRRRSLFFPTKGSSYAGRPIIGPPTKVDIDARGRRIDSGVSVWPVGHDTAKNELFVRLPRDVHFPRDLPDDFFEQLTSEHIEKVRGHLRWVHDRSAARNEILDLMVLTLAVSIRVGVHRMTPERWQRIEDKLKASAAPEAEREKPAEVVPPARRAFIPPARYPGGFVAGWKAR
jgi:phage terminase large subunit GpA-like protein